MGVGGDAKQRERHRDEADPDPLSPSETEPEVPLGEHREQHKPPEITAWASESGSSDNAPTCARNATTEISQPIVHHLERNRSAALRSGWRMSTSGAATAPLCFKRKLRLPPHADATAHSSPRTTPSDRPSISIPSSAEDLSHATPAPEGRQPPLRLASRLAEL